MSLRPPKNFASNRNQTTEMSPIQGEILAETASSLGHQGRKVEKALAGLAEAEDADRETQTYAAAREVWAYFIQRELCGMRDHRLIIREMGIPQSVLNLMGSVRR